MPSAPTTFPGDVFIDGDTDPISVRALAAVYLRASGVHIVLDYAPAGVTINTGSSNPQTIIDTREAIQSAIDAASDAGGGTVLFPPGTYTTDGIIHKSRVNVVAVGRATIRRPDNSAANSFSRLWYIGRGVDTLVKDVTIDGLTFDGNIANQINSVAAGDYHASTDTIAFRGDTEGPYANVQQHHSLFVGAEPGSGPHPGVGCDNVRILNCDFHGSQGDGLAINLKATNIQVTNLTGRKCARGSFDLFGGGSSVVLTGFRIEDWLHVEHDVPDEESSRSYCELSNGYAARLNVLGHPVARPAEGVLAPCPLDVHIANVRVGYGPQFEGVRGVVTNCTFEITESAGASTHRILESDGLRFSNCRFLGAWTLETGQLVSMEPLANTVAVQNVTFAGCEFLGGLQDLEHDPRRRWRPAPLGQAWQRRRHGDGKRTHLAGRSTPVTTPARRSRSPEAPAP